MKNTKANEIPLVAFSQLKAVIAKVLTTSKKQSDQQIQEIRAANVKKHAAKKKAA